MSVKKEIQKAQDRRSRAIKAFYALETQVAQNPTPEGVRALAAAADERLDAETRCLELMRAELPVWAR